MNKLTSLIRQRLYLLLLETGSFLMTFYLKMKKTPWDLWFDDYTGEIIKIRII